VKASEIRDLAERARRGEQLPDSAFGPARLTDEPIDVSDEVMIGKSVRLPMAVLERILAVAQSQGTTFSRVVREWIDEGLERAENGASLDPAVELDRAAAAIEHARKALRGRAA
jgi:predicted DNA-binding protein